MIRISICLSDLPKEKMKKAKNNKIYMNLVIAERREPDQFGNDVTVYADQTKEEREAHKDKQYVGQGKTIAFNQAATPEAVENLPPVDLMNPTNDLPWE